CRADKRATNQRVIAQHDGAKACKRGRCRRIAFARYPGKRQMDTEKRALAHRTFNFNAATHRGDEALRDGKTKPRAFIAARMGLIGLRKLVKDMLAVRFIHADAG